MAPSVQLESERWAIKRREKLSQWDNPLKLDLAKTHGYEI